MRVLLLVGCLLVCAHAEGGVTALPAEHDFSVARVEWRFDSTAAQPGEDRLAVTVSRPAEPIPVETPEPKTFLIIGFGLLALGLLGIRRTRPE